MSDEPTPGPAISAQGRAQWQAIADRITERVPYCEAEDAFPCLLAALTDAEAREGGARYDQALAEDERDAAREEAIFEQHKFAGAVATNRGLAAALQAARDEAAGYRAECERLQLAVSRCHCPHSVVTAAGGPTGQCTTCGAIVAVPLAALYRAEGDGVQLPPFNEGSAL